MMNVKRSGPWPLFSLAGALTAACLAAAWLGSRPAASAQTAPPQAAPPPAVREAGQSAAPLKPELRAQVDEYLKLFGQGKIDEMLSRMPLPSGGNRDEFEALRRQLLTLYSVAGRYSGFDVVCYQPLSPRYYEVYALAYFDKEPVLFQFAFYHPGTNWQVQHFRPRTTDFAQFLEQLPVQRP